MRKEEIACNKQFLLFPTMFSTMYDTYFSFKYTLKCCLQSLSILDQSKILSSDNGLKRQLTDHCFPPVILLQNISKTL